MKIKKNDMMLSKFTKVKSTTKKIESIIIYILTIIAIKNMSYIIEKFQVV